jgi:hypothetical protein
MLGMGKVFSNNPSCTLSNLYVELEIACLRKVGVSRVMKKEEANDPRHPINFFFLINCH